MLLMVEALLLLAALLQDHRAAVEAQIYPLDMAENSVDDLYIGCRNNMRREVETELLNNELNKSPQFKKLWEDGEKNAVNPEDGLTRHNSIATYVYTNSRFDLYDTFNNAVRSEKQKYADGSFTWYSLDFLLTEAIQILKETQKGCKSTYRGTTVAFDRVDVNTEVRFGAFASSSLDREIAKRFGDVSCFEIYTCEGANLSKYSAFPDEEEVLIPPYEKFTVTAVKTRNSISDLWCQTVYILKSAGIRSDLNCALINNPAALRKTFNNYAFCSCFQRKLRLLSRRLTTDQLASLKDKLDNCRRYQLNDDQWITYHHTEREMHSRSSLMWEHHFFPDDQSDQKILCYLFLRSLKISRRTMSSLMPCCRA